MSELAVVIEKLDGMNTKLDETNKLAKENNRSLRGYNNTPGMVADMKDCKDKIENFTETRAVCIGNFAEISKTLHGEGSDKIGLVGEQVIIRRISKWLIAAATALSLSTIGLLIKLAVTAP